MNNIFSIEYGPFGTDVNHRIHVLDAATFKRLFLGSQYIANLSIIVAYRVLRIVFRCRVCLGREIKFRLKSYKINESLRAEV